MGELITRIKEENLKNGKNIFDNYKNNTKFFYEKYTKSSNDVLSIPTTKLQIGGFYFLQYQDDSNWMKYSPVFIVDFKKFDNLIIVSAINFNFIPLEVRATIFDRYMSKVNFESNRLLSPDYNTVYAALLNYGFEYSLVEYNFYQIKYSHKINNLLVPRFLYSGYPINKYDPIKLYSIWKKKLETREKRHQEMMQACISDFYDISNEISENYDVLKGHVDRIQKSFEKYGK